MPRKPTHNPTRRLDALQTIAIELLRTRSRHEILELILKQAMEHLACDAGSLYLRHDDTTLSFEVAVNETIQFDSSRRHLISAERGGIAAYVFRTGESLCIKDVYNLPPECPYRFDKSFDIRMNYRTRSMLVQPLLSSKGERLGVIQLMNRKNSFRARWPVGSERRIRQMPYFSKEDLRFLQSFGALASAAIENASLYESIHKLFESFVHASVKAIESRDPVTRGHSERVALLTVSLADRISFSQLEPIRAIRFTADQLEELRYAALLHDFGKIGVREATLLKAEKLTPEQKIAIQHRIDHFIYINGMRMARQLLAELKTRQRAPTEFDIARFEKGYSDFRGKLKDLESLILELNRPSVLKEDKRVLLNMLAQETFVGPHGEQVPLLLPEEVNALSIPKGSLSEVERLEIESHVTRTYEFLRDIPWGKEIRNVPEIAYAHHEKLDGTGYPRRLKGDEIPIQSRIMAITDIFDALVSPDRPYKKGVPTEKALEILQAEADDGKLDKTVLRVFLEDKVYQLTSAQPEALPLKKVA